MADSVDADVFITIVRQHPVLWDHSHADYSDKGAKRNAWETIIKTFVDDFDENSPAEKKAIGAAFQRKWKTLRDGFTREVLRQKKDSRSGSGASTRKKYMYFDQLTFLQSVIKPATNSVEDNDGQEPDSDSGSTSLNTKDAVPKAKNKSKRTPGEDDVEAAKAKFLRTQNSENADEDRLFMLSLVPELKKIPEHLKLEARANLIGVFSQMKMRYHQNEQNQRSKQYDSKANIVGYQAHGDTHSEYTHPSYQQGRSQSNYAHPSPSHVPAPSIHVNVPTPFNIQHPTPGNPLQVNVPITLHFNNSAVPAVAQDIQVQESTDNPPSVGPGVSDLSDYDY